MYQNRLKIAVAVLVCIAAFLLSGCIKVRMHVTVNPDGSVEQEIVMAAERSLVSLGAVFKGEMFAEIKEDLKSEGYQIDDYRDQEMTGFKAVKIMESLEEIPVIFRYLDEDQFLVVDQGLFSTSYHLFAELDLTGFGPERHIAALVKPDLRFALTLPVKAVDHNANLVSEDGKTLEWELVPGTVNRIEMTARTPNYLFLSLAAIAGIVIVGAAITMLIRLRKNRCDG